MLSGNRKRANEQGLEENTQQNSRNVRTKLAFDHRAKRAISSTTLHLLNALWKKFFLVPSYLDKSLAYI